MGENKRISKYIILGIILVSLIIILLELYIISLLIDLFECLIGQIADLIATIRE